MPDVTPIGFLNATDSVDTMRRKVNELIGERMYENVSTITDNDLSVVIPPTAGTHVDHTILWSISAGTFDCDLPDVTSAIIGAKLRIGKITSTGTLNINPEGADTINGSGTPPTLTTQWSGKLLIAIAVGEWWMVSLAP